jgi:virginiamycin B lyase
VNAKALSIWALRLALALGVLSAGCRGAPLVVSPSAPAAVQTLPAASVQSPVTSQPEASPTAAQPTAGEPGTAAGTTKQTPGPFQVQEYPLPAGTRPHDVAPSPDGKVWYTAQGAGELGRLDPATGTVERIPLGQGSAPHGVIASPDGAAWVTDGGLNAILRVDPVTQAVQTFPLPAGSANANLNTAAFDGDGVLWFTGQNGIYGRLDPKGGQVQTFPAPGGRGPYGITATPQGEIYFASLAGSYLGRIDRQSGAAQVLEPPTPGQGARRVWSDSNGRLWVTEWNAGQLARYDPASGDWQEWRLPGDHPQPYAVYVDERDQVWLCDFGANALLRFDPAGQAFTVIMLPSSPANVRQLLGRPGEVWGAESGVDRLVVVFTRVE